MKWQGEPWPIARRQNRALLYILAVEGKPVTREWLCFLLWPDTSERHARRKLTDALSQLRLTLPDLGLIQTTLDTVVLNRSLLHCDLDVFSSMRSEITTPTTAPTLITPETSIPEAYTQQMSTVELQAAIDHYRGPLLQGFSISNRPEFEAWLTQERQLWKNYYLAGLALLVARKAEANHYTQAVDYAQRFLQVDPLAENMHHMLISLYASTGNRTAAIRQYQACALALANELSIEPMESTKALYQAIVAGETIPASSTSSPHHSYLP